MLRLRFLLLAIAALFCLQTYAQTTPAKPDFKLFFEKTWLHTDRDVYLPGDTLWFKAYLVNAQDNVPAFTSANLHVELIGPEARVYKSEMVRMERGAGNGDMELADTIPAGNYKLRAYTNWMRNFGDNFIFQKDITILSIPGAGANSAGNKTIATVPATAAKLASTTINGNPTVRFFPEGGSLVEGVSALVAVKAENAAGMGAKLNGAILSSANDTVAHFTCDTLGMGLFALLPEKGQSYRAVAMFDKNKPFAVTLPTILSQGLALRVRQADTVLYTIISNAGLPAEGSLPKYSIVMKHGGKTLISQQVQAAGAQTSVAISTAGLPEGVASLTVYNNQNKPECERLVYIHQPDSKNISVKSDKQVYRANEKTTIQVDAAGAADISMAVIDARAQTGDPDNIIAGLMLKSEVRGNIEHASRYFDTTNHSRFRQLDLLLMTQGWRDFVWRRLADTAIRISYTPETALSVKGKVVDRYKDVALPDVNVSLYAPSAKGSKLMAATADKNGNFEFNNLLQFGDAPVVVTARDAKGKDAGRVQLDTARTMPALPKIKDLAAPVNETAYNAVKDQLIKQRATPGLINLKEVKVKSRRGNIQLRDMNVTSFGYKDEVLVPPANIGPKPTIRDYILQASTQAQQDNMAQSNAGNNDFGSSGDDMRFNRIVFFADGKTSDPRLIVDGYEVPVEQGPESMKNALYSRYYDLPAEKAVKIVIKKMMTPPHIGTSSGFVNASGAISNASSVIQPHPIFIIYLTLKPGALETDRPNAVPFALDGYYQARNFYTPVTEAGAKKAGYRATVYWQPFVKTDANGGAAVSYFNSAPGPVKVIVQGIRTDGTPLSGVLSYKVQ